MIRRRDSSVWPSGIILVALLVCAGGLLVSTGVAAAQTADYDPPGPFVGMEVTATDSQIQDGEFYDLHVVEEVDGGTVTEYRFVETLEAEGTEVHIETDSLEPGNRYFILGPGLDSSTDLTVSQTFELREHSFSSRSDDGNDSANTSATDRACGLDAACYYGTVSVDDEPAPPNTTIEAEIDGQVLGSTTVEATGEYGNSTAAGEQLIVEAPTDDEQLNVSFYITPPESDRIAANQSVTWEAGTLTQLNLTATEPASVDSNDDNVVDDDDDVVDDEPNETTVDANQTTDDDSVTDDTTDTAPGFGILLTLVSLAAVVLLSHRRTT